jgi:hypothetical protein
MATHTKTRKRRYTDLTSYIEKSYAYILPEYFKAKEKRCVRSPHIEMTSLTLQTPIYRDLSNNAPIYS